MHPSQKLMAELSKLPPLKSSFIYELFDKGIVKDLLGHVATSNDHFNGPCLYVRASNFLIEHIETHKIKHEVFRDIAGYTWLCF